MTGDPGRSAGGQTPSALEILGFGVTFGLGTGLLEVLFRVVQRYGFGSHLFLGQDMVWLAPLADTVLFLLAAAILLLIRFLSGVVRPAKAAVGYSLMFGTFVFLVPLGPLLTTTRIHTVAALLLALGIGVQGGRMLARRPEAVRRLARRAAPAFALVVAAGFLLVRGGHWLGERRLDAALPEPAAGAPNVLLIILDTVRSADLSLYGYEHPTTPNLELLAEQGITFENAVSTSPWTLPSHASMFTGRYAHELTADWLTPLDDADLTLSEHFAANGYRTAGFVGNLIYATWETGLNRGFSRYEDYPISVAMAINSSWLGRWVTQRTRRWLGYEDFLVRRSAGDINAAFLEWVDRGGIRNGDSPRPFFAFLNYMDAHGPYLPPDSLEGLFGPRRSGRAMADLSSRRDWSADELAAERAAYDGEVAYVDQEIGSVVAALEARGLLDETLLIVASDHGELFGEHGLVDHGNSLYRPLIDVPLVLVAPGRVPEGAWIAEPVSLRDLATTISHLATGVEDAFPGYSLVGLWESRTGTVPTSPILSSVSGGVRMPDWVPVSKGDMESLVSDGYQYIIDGEGNEELYRYAPDRGESDDLAALGTERERLAKMRRSVEELTSGGTVNEAAGR